MMTEEHRAGASQAISVLLTALGISIEPHAFAVAMVVAVWMAVAVSRERPKSQRKGVWVVVANALGCAVVAAMLAEHYLPGVPTALAMVIGGLVSSSALNIITSVLRRFEERGADLADRAINRVVPERKSDK